MIFNTQHFFEPPSVLWATLLLVQSSSEQFDDGHFTFFVFTFNLLSVLGR